MTNSISLSNVGRSFKGTVALDNVSFTVPENTICGLLGRNGAGKTTIMSLVAGHDRPDTGSAQIGSNNPFNDQKTLEKLCFIRDNQRYPDNYRLKHILRVAPDFFPNWDHQLAADIIRDFRIPAKQDIAKFSRGQLSAVAILIGLACRAPITLFDEPYLGLDATARHLFYDYLIRDFSEHPRTILMSTHLIDEMESLLEQVIIVDQGRILVDSDVDTIKGSATTVSGLTADLDAFLLGRHVISRRSIGGLSTALIHESVSATIRAENPLIHFESPSLQDVVAAYGETETSLEFATSHTSGETR